MSTDVKTVPAATAADRLFGLLPRIFRECVTAGSIRYDLRIPRVRHGYVWATDGRICVRLSAIPAVVAAEAAAAEAAGPHAGYGKFPDCAPQFESAGGWSADGRPVPDLSDAEPCGACGGRGAGGLVECPDCGHLVEAPGCAAPCPPCGGTGIDEPLNRGLDVGGAKLSYRFLVVLRDAGATLHPAKEGTATAAVRFTCPDGTEGVVMPLGPDAAT